MRYRGKRAFRLLQVSRAGLFSDLSAGNTCPLRIPVTQLLIKYAYQEAWMSGKGVCLFCRDFRDGLRFPPQISHEETAPFRQSHPKNPLAPIPLSQKVFLYFVTQKNRLYFFNEIGMRSEKPISLAPISFILSITLGLVIDLSSLYPGLFLLSSGWRYISNTPSTP